MLEAHPSSKHWRRRWKYALQLAMPLPKHHVGGGLPGISQISIVYPSFTEYDEIYTHSKETSLNCQKLSVSPCQLLSFTGQPTKFPKCCSQKPSAAKGACGIPLMISTMHSSKSVLLRKQGLGTNCYIEIHSLLHQTETPDSGYISWPSNKYWHCCNEVP